MNNNTILIFTRNSPLRTLLVQADIQQPVFRIDTPRKIARKTTTVRRFLPCDYTSEPLDPFKYEESESSISLDQFPGDGYTDGYTDGGVAMIDSDEIARIHWHHFTSHRVVFKGHVWTGSQLLSGVGPLKGSYLFTIRGVNYEWNLGFTGLSNPKLLLDDGSKTVIAKFHRKNKVFNKRKAYLEITPRGMEILDDIILTFILVEKQRRDKERRSRY